MKKYLMGFIAVILAIGFSAFNAQEPKKTSPTGEKWFVFQGVDPADLGDATKYALDGNGSSPTVCPVDVSSPYRCQILAMPTGSPSRPDLATIIEDRRRTTP